jgi:hypothetical protein
VTAPAKQVAVLALVYRTMYRNCYSGPESLFDELSQYSDGCEGIVSTGAPNISLLGMVASQEIDEIDWALVDLLPQHREERVDLPRFGRAMATFDPVRCDAFLHAYPDDPRAQLADQEWAEPFLSRWEKVAREMRRLEPLTWDREEMNEIALAVCAAIGPWNQIDDDEDDD